METRAPVLSRPGGQRSSPSRERSFSGARLAAANIQPGSHLATDYLNHYNEVVMLLEMARETPEMLAEAADWRPKSYADHFADSGFAESQLAIAAYGKAPPEIRDRFEAATAELDALLVWSLRECAGNRAGGALDMALADIHRLLAQVNQIIHSGDAAPAQAEQSQADIDALFD